MLHVMNAVSRGGTLKSRAKLTEASRYSKIEMLGGEADMWTMSKREDGMCVLAPKDYGATKEENERGRGRGSY